MNSKLTLGAAGALLALVASSASAAVIVNYSMTAAPSPDAGTLSVAPTATASNVTATSLANQSGAGASGSFNYNNGTDRASSWGVTTGSTGTFANAFTAGSYITFSITAAAGYTVDVSSITFQAASGSSSTTSDRAFYLVSASSAGGFTSSMTVLSTDRTVFGGGTIPVQSGTGGISTVPNDYTVSGATLASIGGISISDGATQYFRFYLQAGSGQALTFDDIIVNGTVSPISAIPEPSAFAAVAGLAGLGLAGLRRRRR